MRARDCKIGLHYCVPCWTLICISPPRRIIFCIKARINPDGLSWQLLINRRRYPQYEPLHPFLPACLLKEWQCYSPTLNSRCPPWFLWSEQMAFTLYAVMETELLVSDQVRFCSSALHFLACSTVALADRFSVMETFNKETHGAPLLHTNRLSTGSGWWYWASLGRHCETSSPKLGPFPLYWVPCRSAWPNRICFLSAIALNRVGHK